MCAPALRQKRKGGGNVTEQPLHRVQNKKQTESQAREPTISATKGGKRKEDGTYKKVDLGSFTHSSRGRLSEKDQRWDAG